MMKLKHIIPNSEYLIIKKEVWEKGDHPIKKLIYNNVYVHWNSDEHIKLSNWGLVADIYNQTEDYYLFRIIDKKKLTFAMMKYGFSF